MPSTPERPIIPLVPIVKRPRIRFAKCFHPECPNSQTRCERYDDAGNPRPAN